MHLVLIDWTRRVLFPALFAVVLFIANEVQAQKLENTLLWKIEGDSIETSYVFGTFHLLPQEDFELKDKVKLAFRESEQIVMELDMDDPSMQMEMMKNIQMQDGQTLDKFISAEDLGLLDEQLQEAVGLTAAQVNTFKPFMVETFLLPTFIEGTPASYEMTFVQMAVSRAIPIEGLEEVADQTQIFDQIPYQDQAEDLVDILKDREDMEGLFSQMIKLYKKEEVDKLYEESLDYFSASEVDLLLHKRNSNWIDKIGNYASEKPTFFAVGAGHLGGEQGVVNLLLQAGYKVTPVLE